MIFCGFLVVNRSHGNPNSNKILILIGTACVSKAWHRLKDISVSVSFLPLCLGFFLLQGLSSIDTWVWFRCFALHNCQKNMQASIKWNDKLRGIWFWWSGQFGTSSQMRWFLILIRGGMFLHYHEHKHTHTLWFILSQSHMHCPYAGDTH